MRIKKIIVNEVKQYLAEKEQHRQLGERYRSAYYNSLFAESLQTLEEGDSEKSALCLQRIKAGKWERATPQSFHKSLTCHNQPEDECKVRHPEMLTPYSPAELSKMKLFKVAGFDVGFALKRHTERPGFNELVAVHNNEPGVGGIGVELVAQAKRSGACYLDHFDVPILNGLYGDAGFKTYDTSPFNAKYVGPGFVEKYGEADVLYRQIPGCDPEGENNAKA